ncbi:MAG: TraM recognition domain-containing protein [Phycisphaerales bacterium]|nr:TraM recognition domain-containing protein [Phycisphaerales bacterium]
MAPDLPNRHKALPVRTGTGGDMDRRSPTSTQLERADPTLDRPLLTLKGGKWKFRDAFEGTQIFGGTGSGKTTGSGAAIGREFLRAKFGGLVLTAKADDAERWKGWAQELGRGGDIVEIRADSACAFNILQYEFDRCGGHTHNLVSLIMGALTSGGEGAVSTSEPYWTEALRELLIHAIDTLVLGTIAERVRDGASVATARPDIRLSELDRLIRTAPKSVAELRSERWRKRSRCWQLLDAADWLSQNEGLTRPRERDLEQTMAYWLNDYANLSERTRTSIVSTFTAKVAGLLRSPVRELFFEDTDDRLCPEVSFSEPSGFGQGGGHILILNLPVKVHGEVGRLVQVLYKTIWQRAADRRAGLFSLTADEREKRHRAGTTGASAAHCTCPAFLWADESQYFITLEDMLFQQTARTSRVATVYLTQNVGNYAIALGRRGNDSQVNSFLGNLQTKIFHSNGDPTTNQFAENTFGKHWISVRSRSQSQSSSVQDGHLSITKGDGDNVHPQLVPVVEAREFTLLASGGPRFGLRIQAWIFQAGRNWKSSDIPGEAASNAVFHEFEQVL